MYSLERIKCTYSKSGGIKNVHMNGCLISKYQGLVSFRSLHWKFYNLLAFYKHKYFYIDIVTFKANKLLNEKRHTNMFPNGNV